MCETADNKIKMCNTDVDITNTYSFTRQCTFEIKLYNISDPFLLPLLQPLPCRCQHYWYTTDKT